MSSPTTGAKSKFSIGTTTAATDAASFAADTFTAIDEIESFGAFGDQAETIKYTVLGDDRVKKLQGAKDAGSFDLTCIYLASDAGQAAAQAAFDAGNVYNVKVELGDALTSGAGPHHGTTFYMRAVVTEAQIDAGNSKEPAKIKFKFEVTSAVVTVAAA
ncbi:hypothetical protein A1351_14040 [Methylosinus sp. R-45379]|uniref:phage tail tube protein n=1 Tax=Methylosinus sp. R-45379 TaxID=980563 RepID=UPI0007C96E68|nr:phage tail tube protein [Methylosinus sp. R-45379]OAI26959.1 hypothetical protein A1351_14040 [Methylosinus sp. R-45379]